MARKKNWHDTGYDEGLAGEYDPPMQPGHRSYEDYVIGHMAGSRELDRQREAGDYYGARVDA